jgi:Flp pilus assembly protein TadB
MEQRMAQQQRRSVRDQVYLDSPGFEPYMAAGVVFVAVFTAAFIFSIKIGLAWLAWPGLLVAVLVGYGVLRWLQRREYARKLAEVEANPVPDARR